MPQITVRYRITHTYIIDAFTYIWREKATRIPHDFCSTTLDRLAGAWALGNVADASATAESRVGGFKLPVFLLRRRAAEKIKLVAVCRSMPDELASQQMATIQYLKAMTRAVIRKNKTENGTQKLTIITSCRVKRFRTSEKSCLASFDIVFKLSRTVSLIDLFRRWICTPMKLDTAMKNIPLNAMPANIGRGSSKKIGARMHCVSTVPDVQVRRPRKRNRPKGSM